MVTASLVSGEDKPEIRIVTGLGLIAFKPLIVIFCPVTPLVALSVPVPDTVTLPTLGTPKSAGTSISNCWIAAAVLDMPIEAFDDGRATEVSALHICAPPARQPTVSTLVPLFRPPAHCEYSSTPLAPATPPTRA